MLYSQSIWAKPTSLGLWKASTVNASTLTIVLIHGGFVDGSGWAGVHNILKKDGYHVAVVQNPTASLADDVAFTRRVIAAQPGKGLLVGHSYGGVVVTEAGADPKVAGLVYVAAFAPDKGESVASPSAAVFLQAARAWLSAAAQIAVS